MQEANKFEILDDLRTADVNTPVGGQIENYYESFPVTAEIVPVFERFLLSSDVSNRSAALAALVVYGKVTGYEVDALLLHYQSRDDGSAEEFAAIDYLRRMRDQSGSRSAGRVLELLDKDPYVKGLYCDV